MIFTGILNTCTRLWLTESEQTTPVVSIKDVVRSSVKVPEFDKHLKTAGGHIGRNVVEIRIKTKTIVRKPLMIKKRLICNKTQTTNRDNASKETIIWRLQVQFWLQASNNTGILNTCTRLWQMESEQTTPVNSIKFREGSRVRQTPEEGRKSYRPKRRWNNNKDEDNSPKTLIVIVFIYVLANPSTISRIWHKVNF